MNIDWLLEYNPILLALALVLAAFTFVRAEAASVVDLVPHLSVPMAATLSQPNLTSTITATQGVTTAVISGVSEGSTSEAGIVGGGKGLNITVGLR